MSKIVYYEDLFIEFYNLMYSTTIFLEVESKDSSAIESFYSTIYQDKGLTQAQAGYVIRLLEKYKLISKINGFDYSQDLKSLTWKKPFRVLDLSKSIAVEIIEEQPTVVMKMPWAIKEKFEKELTPRTGYSSGTWDPEKKHRAVDIYAYNLVHLFEFVEKHQFSIDESFIDLVNQVEEIWQQQENIVPYSFIDNEQVCLYPKEEGRETFWEENKYSDVAKDLFLAKSMGFCYRPQGNTLSLVEKISSSQERFFWIEHTRDFFKLYQDIEGVTAVILDRNTKNIKGWIENFVTAAENLGISRKIIKVCFRESKTEDTSFNQWVKDNELGGKVEDGKIFIFLQKPAKWLFKDKIDVKIIAINSFTPVNEPTMNVWTNSHHCVVYIGDVKPTPPRTDKFVKL